MRWFASTVVFALVAVGSVPLGPVASAKPAPAAARKVAKGATYTERLAKLRTRLERVGIELVVREPERDSVVRTAPCEGTVELGTKAGPLKISKSACYQCELAEPGGHGARDAEILAAFTAALDVYPDKLLRASGVSQLLLCDTLRRNNDEGFGFGLGGVADLAGRRVLLEPSALSTPAEAERRIRAVTAGAALHHELFHLLELEITPGQMLDDPAWEALNPRDFRYRGLAAEVGGMRGFITAHATANVREDRATIYEHLIANSEALCKRAAVDPIIGEKARLIWQRVSAAAGFKAGFLARRAPCFAQWLVENAGAQGAGMSSSSGGSSPRSP